MKATVTADIEWSQSLKACLDSIPIRYNAGVFTARDMLSGLERICDIIPDDLWKRASPEVRKAFRAFHRRQLKKIK